MESEIIELAKKVQEAVGELEGTLQTPLTESAIKIANIALRELTGDALSKALKISASIVEFEDALKLKSG